MANETASDAMGRPKSHRENRKKLLSATRKVQDNQAHAVAKFVRVPPRKARLVMDEVRGLYAIDALAFLRFIPNRAAGYISKVLASAVANAANNHGLNPENLKLVEARVDEGPRMKRVQPRAQGRAYRILKRMSHIMVIVEEVEPKPRKPRKPATTGRRAQAARAARQAAPPQPVAVEETTLAAAVEEETTPPVVAEDTTPIPVAEETSATEETSGEVTTEETGAPTDVDAEK